MPATESRKIAGECVALDGLTELTEGRGMLLTATAGTTKGPAGRIRYDPRGAQRQSIGTSADKINAERARTSSW